MAIQVVCPGCRKRFQVSDQFAGKTGPCPSCKTSITIPTKEQEVKVHAPEEFTSGGRTAKAAIDLRPIPREEVKFSFKAAAAILGSALLVVIVTLLVRRFGLVQDPAAWRSFFVKAVGLLLISPPLVIGGYSFLRDDGLEPYRGKELLLRAGAIALVYVILWGLFGRIAAQVIQPGELWTWLMLVPPFVIVGALAGLALDLDFGSGALLYSFYVILTVFLRAIAGLGWVWNITAQ